MKDFKVAVRAGLFFIVLLGISCGSRKELAYLHNIEQKTSEQAARYEPTLQPDDLLSIQVVGRTQEISAPFNLPDAGQNDPDNRTLRTYLVDNEGYIDFPVLGKVKLGGLTRTEAKNKLTTLVSEYVVNPTIVFRIVNFKVSVLGEVGRPGTYTTQGERMTLFEALGLAGDLTIYGRRDNILLVREQEGKKTSVRLNIADASFADSPYYYLAQNDIIYVEPNNTRIHSSTIGPDIYIIFSGISVLTTIIVLLSR